MLKIFQQNILKTIYCIFCLLLFFLCTISIVSLVKNQEGGGCKCTFLQDNLMSLKKSCKYQKPLNMKFLNKFYLRSLSLLLDINNVEAGRKINIREGITISNQFETEYHSPGLRISRSHFT